MTKKKKPDSPSPFDDFKMDDERFKKLFKDEDSLENTTQYLNDLLNTTLDEFSNTINKFRPTPPPKTPPQQNSNLTSIKQDFPAKSKSKPSKNSQPTPPPSSDLLDPTVNSTSNTMKQPKKSTVNSLASKKPRSSTSKSQSTIKKTPKQMQPNQVFSKLNLINKFKKTFQSFSNILNVSSKSRPKDVSSIPKSHSMDKSLERLKKREEDIKQLLDNDKGNIS